MLHFLQNPLETLLSDSVYQLDVASVTQPKATTADKTEVLHRLVSLQKLAPTAHTKAVILHSSSCADINVSVHTRCPMAIHVPEAREPQFAGQTHGERTAS